MVDEKFAKSNMIKSNKFDQTDQTFLIQHDNNSYQPKECHLGPSPNVQWALLICRFNTSEFDSVQTWSPKLEDLKGPHELDYKHPFFHRGTHAVSSWYP